jgi:methionine biosynthesis protein MetW
MSLRPDLAIIADHVVAGSRILDVGCGDGALMAALRAEKSVDARGLEIDAANVAAAVGRGLSVVQGDADTDLADYPDGAFDYAILSQTLQTTHAPDVVLDHLLRIGRRAFVSFPNFAHWRVRLSLLWGGRMPVTRLVCHAQHPSCHDRRFPCLRGRTRDRGRACLVSLRRQTDHVRCGQLTGRTRGFSAAAIKFGTDPVVLCSDTTLIWINWPCPPL